MQIILVGVSDDRDQYWSPELLRIFSSHHCFSGGKRHHDIVRPRLPEQYEWIEITPPIDGAIRSYAQHDSVVVVASCDPIFNGIGQRIMQLLPDAEIKLYPYFHSLQLLAHAALLPYQDMHVVSLTGRPWSELDRALISGEKMIGVLTDKKEHTPRLIAQRLLEYGYTNYNVVVGCHLGNSELQEVHRLSPVEVAERDFAYPNNLILCRLYPLPRPFGIEDRDFTPLNGRDRMITKMPIRLLSLSMLGLHRKQQMWDVGSCTGSISIEAKLQCPHLQISAFEIRPEGQSLIEENSRKLHTPGIDFYGGDFLSTDISSLPSPEAVFIGGHGGKLIEIIERIWQVLSPDGVVVFNAVSDESERLFREGIARQGGSIERETLIRIDEYNPIRVMQATKRK